MRNAPQLNGEPVAYSSQGFGRMARRLPLQLAAARPTAVSRPANQADLCTAPASAGHDALTLAHRRRQVAAAVAQTLSLFGRLARRIAARSWQQEQTRAIARALRGLDERTMRDLGFDRCNVLSIAAEAAGAIDSTRVHVLSSARTLGL